MSGEEEEGVPTLALPGALLHGRGKPKLDIITDTSKVAEEGGEGGSSEAGDASKVDIKDTSKVDSWVTSKVDSRVTSKVDAPLARANKAQARQSRPDSGESAGSGRGSDGLRRNGSAGSSFRRVCLPPPPPRALYIPRQQYRIFRDIRVYC